jgi:hypothetical protein
MAPVDPLPLVVLSVDVQRDLDLSPAQLGELREALHGFEDRRRELRGSRDAKRQREGQDAIYDFVRSTLVRVLSEQQQRRLEQLALQAGGICSVIAHPHMQGVLELDEAQVTAVLDVCQDHLPPPPPGPGPGRKAAGEPPAKPPVCNRDAQKAAAAEERALALLTAAQRKKLDQEVGLLLDPSRLVQVLCSG